MLNNTSELIRGACVCMYVYVLHVRCIGAMLQMHVAICKYKCCCAKWSQRTHTHTHTWEIYLITVVLLYRKILLIFLRIFGAKCI